MPVASVAVSHVAMRALVSANAVNTSGVAWQPVIGAPSAKKLTTLLLLAVAGVMLVFPLVVLFDRDDWDVFFPLDDDNVVAVVAVEVAFDLFLGVLVR